MSQKRKPPQSRYKPASSTPTTSYTAEVFLQAARTTDFSDAEAIQRFMDRFPFKSSNPAENDAGTERALQLLAHNTELLEYKPFLQWACNKHPELLRCKHGGLPPLHQAIESGNAEFVRIVLDGSNDSKTLFTPKDSSYRTCLHFAIHLKSIFTKPIIEKAKQLKSTSKSMRDMDVFTTKTEPDGLTPLHCAVSHWGVVSEGDTDEIDGKGPAGLPGGTGVTTPEANQETVTMDTEQKSIQSSIAVTDGNIQIERKAITDAVTEGTHDHKGDTRVHFPDEPEESGAKGLLKSPTRSMSFKAGLTGGKRQEAEPYLVSEIVKDLIDAMDGALLVKDTNQNTPYQLVVAMVGGYLKSERSKGVSELDDPEIFDMNLRYLLDYNDIRSRIIKRHCIRNMSRDDALRALYKVGDERVIEFDLSQLLSSTINAEFLKGLAKVLRFESALSYVALPRLSIENENDIQQYLDELETQRHELGKNAGFIDGEEEDKDQAKEKSKGKPKADIESGNKGKGLTNFCHIFRWLRLLDVTSIVKVTVIDDVEPSHSDAAIEACLDGFDVETWNWKRFDICSDVILKAAPNVKDLILYSSGNNAVLLGWASSTGLCKLKKLRSVYVVVREGLESKSRLQNYIKEFEKTLQSYDHLRKVSIECTLDDPTNSLASVFADKDMNPEDNPWLQYMKAFGKFLQNTKLRAKPVSIAIIDDGINTNLEAFTDKIHSGDSFYDPTLDAFHGRRGVYYVPSGRHGTLMAQLVCTLCPAVKLFVAQLQLAPGRERQRSFTTQSAIKAINWAVDRQVDIISMSWSIDDDNAHSAELKKAITAADNNGILMFCSCIDRGAAYKGDTFPGNTGIPFRIGAARVSGEKLSWVAGQESDYLLPGENIKPDEPDSWSHHRSGPFGSSIATALASGLAGALLYCDRLVGCTDKVDTMSGEMKVDYLRNRTNMKKVLDNMVSEGTGSKFIDVRNSLGLYVPKPSASLTDPDAKKNLQSFMDAMKGKRSR